MDKPSTTLPSALPGSDSATPSRCIQSKGFLDNGLNGLYISTTKQRDQKIHQEQFTPNAKEYYTITCETIDNSSIIVPNHADKLISFQSRHYSTSTRRGHFSSFQSNHVTTHQEHPISQKPRLSDDDDNTRTFIHSPYLNCGPSRTPLFISAGVEIMCKPRNPDKSPIGTNQKLPAETLTATPTCNTRHTCTPSSLLSVRPVHRPRQFRP
jgi:hypothetical protein